MSAQYVDRWLRASTAADISEFVSVDVQGGTRLERRDPSRVWVADAEPFVRGWEVVVAAEFAPAPATTEVGSTDEHPAAPTTEWYRVEVLRLDDAGTSWEFSGLPSQVGAPATLEKSTHFDFTSPADPADSRVATLDGWLTAYLTGNADPQRWIAEDAWSPPAPVELFDRVELKSATSEGPADSPTVAVNVLAWRADTAVPMSYTFQLGRRGERWEITDVFPRSVQHEQ